MPRISVVVPIYNVEEYLEECLESLRRQTFEDLEIVMVDDGSTDGSGTIAQGYAQRDPRFKLVTRPNGGLSAARNTGIDNATGEFLAFVDSDDIVAQTAYAQLHGALEKTGSDFATGNVQRLTAMGTRRVYFLTRAFAETRLKTHVLRYPPLLADRTAWNKLFRREFWDRNGFRFPEGVVNEDIPVMLPAHFAARSVDVLADPVYFWRLRDLGGPSITQTRATMKALHDRITACEGVIEYLEKLGLRKAKRWYYESLVADDLRLYLDVFDRAEPEWQQEFLDRVNALLEGVDDRIFKDLTAINRLKWHLARRRMVDELVEVRQFQRDEMADRAPLKVGRHWYGDYPFRGDPERGIPDHVYRLDSELRISARIEDVAYADDRLRISGLAFIEGVGAPRRGYARISVAAIRPGRLRRLRLLLAPLRFRTRVVHRPDANARTREKFRDISWSGFTAELDPRKLRARPGRWDVYVGVRVGRLRRRAWRFQLDDVHPAHSVRLPNEDVLARAVLTEDNLLELQVQESWASVTGASVEDGRLRLDCTLHGPMPEADLRLELRGGAEARTVRVPLAGGVAEIPLSKLRDAIKEPAAADDVEGDDEELELGLEEDEEGGPVWVLFVTGGGRRRVVLDADDRRWRTEDRELSVFRTRLGDAAIAVRAPHAHLTDARWDGDQLILAGEAPHSEQPQELLLYLASAGAREPFDLGAAATGGPFEVRMSPSRMPSLAGDLPLREGVWSICTRPVNDIREDTYVPVAVAPELRERMPIGEVLGFKPFVLGVGRDDRARLAVRKNLTIDERGPYHQRRLRETAYAARRSEPLEDTVVYTSFHGRQYSDSPRAIHDELVRRGAPLEHLWIVRDDRANVPEGVRVLRDGSREAHAALARTRFFVTNDHFPEWFLRRDDQVCVQTWHGTPFKRLGFDVPTPRGITRRFDRNWDERISNWQYVISPSRFSTPILQRAYRLRGEMLETGYPRDDVLAGPGRDRHTRRVRERLGLSEGARTVLYAPTFRDHIRDRRGRYRLDLQLDLERVRDALGGDTVILIRKHHYITDAIPVIENVLDVSGYPDGTELLLAADVLITDYSSLSVDFANTRRPMLFFTYDLDLYADEIRGFYIPFEETVPGPLLRTSDEVVEALREIDAVQAAYASKHEAFVERFCEFDDGGASGRVVDRVFQEFAATG